MVDEAEYARFLLEAQEEVDAMLPHTPPIAPRRRSAEELRWAAAQLGQLANAASSMNSVNLLNAQTQMVANPYHGPQDKRIAITREEYELMNVRTMGLFS